MHINTISKNVSDEILDEIIDEIVIFEGLFVSVDDGGYWHYLSPPTRSPPFLYVAMMPRTTYCNIVNPSPCRSVTLKVTLALARCTQAGTESVSTKSAY